MVVKTFSKLLPDEARAAVEESAHQISKLPESPVLAGKGKSSRKSRNQVNIEKCIERLFNAQENEDAAASHRNDISPSNSSADLARATQTLGYFETYF